MFHLLNLSQIDRHLGKINWISFSESGKTFLLRFNTTENKLRVLKLIKSYQINNPKTILVTTPQIFMPQINTNMNEQLYPQINQNYQVYPQMNYSQVPQMNPNNQFVYTQNFNPMMNPQFQQVPSVYLQPTQNHVFIQNPYQQTLPNNNFITSNQNNSNNFQNNQEIQLPPYIPGSQFVNQQNNK